MPTIFWVSRSEMARKTAKQWAAGIAIVSLASILATVECATAEDPTRWGYSKDQMAPFWTSGVIYRESILFVRDPESGEARGDLLFPIDRILSIEDASGTIRYQEGDDYLVDHGKREVVIPVDSKIKTFSAGDLRRPAGSQPYRLAHRDGNGEILFGGKLEYHEMQTWVTYRKASSQWPLLMPKFNPETLPTTIGKLRNGDPVTIALLGDSISTGCNASGWGDGAPFQPPYQDLLKLHLEATYGATVHLKNFSVGGTSTPWGVTQIPAVVESSPDLIILAFGMNDAGGTSAEQYEQNTARMIEAAREKCPNVEFILIASMLGNRDWTTLNHARFAEYRNKLAELVGPGITLADMTSVWDEFLRRKKDWDITGNGVNHPNDFGHRVYAQILSSLLVESSKEMD